MGLSWIGLGIALAVLTPNVTMLAFPPRDGTDQITSAGWPFTIAERVGQVGCVLVLTLSPHSFSAAPLLDLRFALMVAALIVYYGLWLRYLVLGRTVRLLFQSLGVIPIPMAVFPVLVFALAAAWGLSPWLACATLTLALGHLTNSWHTHTHLARP